MLDESLDNPYKIDWENLIYLERGGGCSVYRGTILNLNNNASSESARKYVAIKKIDTEAINNKQIDAIQAEIKTMKALNHENIVRYLGVKIQYDKINILLEYADCGSIRRFYQANGPLLKEEIFYCLSQILSGLNYLHEQEFAHRDVKCANCLLFSSSNSLPHRGIVKLADFGASKHYDSASVISGLKGTPLLLCYVLPN